MVLKAVSHFRSRESFVSGWSGTGQGMVEAPGGLVGGWNIYNKREWGKMKLKR